MARYLKYPDDPEHDKIEDRLIRKISNDKECAIWVHKKGGHFNYLMRFDKVVDGRLTVGQSFFARNN